MNVPNKTLEINRDELAYAITEAGDVRHDREGYYVVRDEHLGEPRASIVSRKTVFGGTQKIVCDCADFVLITETDATFECEHIIAVRRYNSNAVSDQLRTRRSDADAGRELRTRRSNS